MSDEVEPRVRVGRVIKPHGVTGELVVEPLGASMDALEVGADVWLGDSAAPLAIVGMRPHAGRWLLRLESIADRDAAERRRGQWLLLPETVLEEPGPDEAYVDDLVGAMLVDAAGAEIGRIVAIIERAPHDLLEVDLGGRRELVPMVADWLVELDLERQRVVMRLPEGLL